MTNTNFNQWINGTVLPRPEDLIINHKYNQKMKRDKKIIAQKKNLLNGIQRGGELQYHENQLYKIVGNDMRIRVFEKRADGDYFIRYE